MRTRAVAFVPLLVLSTACSSSPELRGPHVTVRATRIVSSAGYAISIPEDFTVTTADAAVIAVGPRGSRGFAPSISVLVADGDQPLRQEPAGELWSVQDRPAVVRSRESDDPATRCLQMSVKEIFRASMKSLDPEGRR